jgi:hypothetical protein
MFGLDAALLGYNFDEAYRTCGELELTKVGIVLVFTCAYQKG